MDALHKVLHMLVFEVSREIVLTDLTPFFGANAAIGEQRFVTLIATLGELIQARRGLDLGEVVEHFWPCEFDYRLAFTDALALADEKVHLLDVFGRADPVIIAGEDFNLRRQWAALITGDSLGLGVIEVEIT